KTSSPRACASASLSPATRRRPNALVFGFDRRDELVDFTLLGIGQILLHALGIYVQQVEQAPADDDIVNNARATTLAAAAAASSRFPCPASARNNWTCGRCKRDVQLNHLPFRRPEYFYCPPVIAAVGDH